MTADSWASAASIAAGVAGGTLRAADVVETALATIARRNPVLNAFTDITADRARARAAAIDAGAEVPGPLAGVPFAVKNLIDVAGLPTLRRVAHQPRPAAGRRRRHAGRAPRGGRRRARGRAQHGRIRL